MGHNRGQLPQRLSARYPPCRAGHADGLKRLSGRIPPQARGHPVNHHVAGRRQAPAGLGKPGCPSPPPCRHGRSPQPRQEGTRHLPTRASCTPLPLTLLPPPPHDLLPRRRVKDPAAIGSRQRTDINPGPPPPRTSCTPLPLTLLPPPPHDLLPGSRVKDPAAIGSRQRTDARPATPPNTVNNSSGTTCGAQPIQVSRCCS